jgi:hypothetical protein
VKPISRKKGKKNKGRTKTQIQRKYLKIYDFKRKRVKKKSIINLIFEAKHTQTKL